MKGRISPHPAAIRDLELLRHRRALALAAVLDLEGMCGSLAHRIHDLEEGVEQAKTLLLLGTLEAQLAHAVDCQNSAALDLPKALRRFDTADVAALASGAPCVDEDELCTAQAEGTVVSAEVEAAREFAEASIEDSGTAPDLDLASIQTCLAS